MNRRNFLKMLGVGLAAAAAPKVIFDMGANLWRPEYQKPTGLTLATIERALIKVRAQGGHPNIILCSFPQYEAIEKELSQMQRYAIPEEIGFKGIEIHAAGLRPLLMRDRWCPEKSFYLLERWP